MKLLHEYYDEYIQAELNKGRVVHKEGDLYKNSDHKA